MPIIICSFTAVLVVPDNRPKGPVRGGGPLGKVADRWASAREVA